MAQEKETPYLNREIREMFEDVKKYLERIEVQTTLTNGKVRKIILAIAVIGGVLAGVVGKEIIIPTLFSIL